MAWHAQVKHKHWRGVWSIFGLRSAPVLEFHARLPIHSSETTHFITLSNQGYYVPIRLLKTVLLLLVLSAELAFAVPPKLLTPSLPNAIMNVPYSGRLMIGSATAGGSSVNTLTGLPPGLTFTNNVGNYLISGTPTAAGSFPLNLTATNSDGTLAIFVPFRVDQFATNVAAISAGGQHSCVVVNGGVQCWGANANGQLGNNSTVASSVAVRAITAGSNATAVSAGSLHTCAVVAGGLQCWGANGNGQIGNNSTAQSPVPVSIFPPGSNVTTVAAGGNHTCAVVNGGVQCWGQNISGQLGNNSFSSSLVPVTAIAALSGVTVVATGASHTCAISNGGLRCWGANGLGTLGNGGASNSSAPVTIVAEGASVAAIALGGNHSCMIAAGGSIFCWGQNNVGQVPGGLPVERNPLRVDIVPAGQVFTSIAAGANHTCANSTTGVTCWGSNSGSQVGTDRSAIVATPALTLASGGATANVITAVAAGSLHSCAIVNGGVQCWGTNSVGVLGTNVAVFSTLPVPSLPLAPGIGSSVVSVGRDSACAKSTPSSLMCWGSNTNGKLGDGGLVPESNVPVDVALAPSGLIGLGLSVWDRHSCAVVNGGVQCWGANDSGQLGNNSIVDSPTPVEAIPASSNIFLVGTGNTHTCAVTFTGIVFCWGANNAGQFGNGNNVPSRFPVLAINFGAPVGYLSARGGHTCVVIGGGVKCWGNNSNLQLGVTVVNGFSHSTVPVDAIPPGSIAQSVAAGNAHTCAAINGGVKCWGSNSAGQLGDNSAGSTAVPVTAIAASSGVTWLSSGFEHNCVTINGGAQCWGRNTFGQLGNGSTVSSPTPVNAISANSDVFTIGAGTDHSCAATRTGIVCWGSNANGQLADAPTYPLRKVYAAIPLPSVPGAPLIVNNITGPGNVTLSFNAPASDGGLPITAYSATCTAPTLSTRTGTALGGATTISITGMTGNVQYSCSMVAINASGSSAASNSMTVVPGVAPLELLGVFSRKTHGAAGVRDLPLDRSVDIAGAITVEPRAIGSGHRIVFQFNNPIFQLGTVTVTDSVGSPFGSATLAPGNNEVIVTLTGIPDKRRAKVTLGDVNAPADSGGGVVALGFLVGDVNGDRVVNGSDTLAIKSRAGQAATAANFKFDLNATGVITAADIAGAKARSGLLIP